MAHLHELRVVACVDHNAMHPLCVSEMCSSQEDLIWTQWHCAGIRNTRPHRVKVTLQQDDRMSLALTL